MNSMKIKYRHISDPSVFKEFNTHLAFVTMPSIFKGDRTQLEYDEFLLNKFKAELQEMYDYGSASEAEYLDYLYEN